MIYTPEAVERHETTGVLVHFINSLISRTRTAFLRTQLIRAGWLDVKACP